MTVLQERTKALSKFTRACKGLENVLNATKKVRATLEKRFKQLEESWNDLQARHEELVKEAQATTEGLDLEEHLKWIEVHEERYQELEARVDEFIDDDTVNAQKEAEERDETARQKEELGQKKKEEDLKKREVNKNKELVLQRRTEFSLVRNSTVELLKKGKDDSVSVVSAINDVMDRMKTTFDDCHKLQDEMIREGYIGDSEWYTTVLEEYNSIRSECQIFLEERTLKKEAASRSSLRLGKIEFKKFDGSIRKYASFRDEFLRHIKPEYSIDKEAIVLKQYLCDEVKSKVESYGEDAEEIWKYLDERYGDESTLVDLIISELDSIEKLDDSKPQEILKLIEIVEKANIDLKRLKRENELNNATIVGKIERRMTARMEEEWVKIVTGDNRESISRNKFPELWMFLQAIKRRLEYKMCGIRTERSILGSTHYAGGTNEQDYRQRSQCAIHTPSNHTTAMCNAFKELTLDDAVEL